jgi:cephalosporin hydroxylase
MRIPQLWPGLSMEEMCLDRYRQQFLRELIIKTRDFSNVHWLGVPLVQNILDLWIIQETISEIKPAFVIETGTNRGGSALFYACLLDLLGRGQVITVDIAKQHALAHPRINFLIGSSVHPDIVSAVKRQVTATPGPVLVILDSDHAAAHVLEEMERYGPLVTPGSYMLVQDGHVDVLDLFPQLRPGPLAAIFQFLNQHPEFAVDRAKCEKFLITHHPAGWLRKVSGS